jgi:hypothetical protein
LATRVFFVGAFFVDFLPAFLADFFVVLFAGLRVADFFRFVAAIGAPCE